MLRNNLAELLKNQEQVFNKAYFAKKIGLSRETLTQILLGHTKNPGVYTLAKIADALQISIDELIGRKISVPDPLDKNTDIIINNPHLLEAVASYVPSLFQK